jgi:hypothetical protein
MGCLNDYIGIRWCGGSASAPSSLYINDLPGLSIKQFNSITDEENGTFLSVWNTVQNRAERRFALDVREAMGAKYRLKSLAQGVNLGKVFVDASVPQYILSGSTAIHLELNSVSDPEYTPSPLLQINLQNISYYCQDVGDTGGTFNFNVYDLDTGESLYSTSLTINNEYWNDYEINQSFVASNINQQPLKLRMVLSPAAPYSTTLIQLPNNIQNPQCCGVSVHGAVQTTDKLSYTPGITATFNVTCSWEGLICQNKNLFSRAFWYLCGIEFLTELIYSTTLSKWTTIGMNQMKDLRAEYEVEYQKSLKQVADGMYLDCDCCLDCASPVQIRTASQFY